MKDHVKKYSFEMDIWRKDRKTFTLKEVHANLMENPEHLPWIIWSTNYKWK